MPPLQSHASSQSSSRTPDADYAMASDATAGSCGVKELAQTEAGTVSEENFVADSPVHHVIRNDTDLHENLEYIAMNPVKAGHVTRPQFYPYTGFLV